MLRWISGKIKAGLAKTRGVFTGVFDLLRGKGKVDQHFLDELEKRLYLADVGTQATAQIVDRVRHRRFCVRSYCSGSGRGNSSQTRVISD